MVEDSKQIYQNVSACEISTANVACELSCTTCARREPLLSVHLMCILRSTGKNMHIYMYLSVPVQLVDEQRKYFKAVKDFQDECNKNDWLTSKLEQITRGQ